MSRFLRQLSITFTAGCFGALVSSSLAWYLGSMGIPQKFGMAPAPAWSLSYLYPRVLWGGLWGWIFMVPIWRSGFWTGVFSRGIILSFLPTAFQLFYFFPFVLGKGMMGLELGSLTPVFICLYNAVWGICTGFWLYLSKT